MTHHANGRHVLLLLKLAAPVSVCFIWRCKSPPPVGVTTHVVLQMVRPARSDQNNAELTADILQVQQSATLPGEGRIAERALVALVTSVQLGVPVSAALVPEETSAEVALVWHL